MSATDSDHTARQARNLLVRLGYRVTEPPPPPPEHHCAVCGMTDEENYDDGFGSLVDFRLIVADGEEGYSDVTRFFCQDHMEVVSPQLVALGFGSHIHGSTTFVEADPEACGGYEGCDLYDKEAADREVY